jgi:hypothetical protein
LRAILYANAAVGLAILPNMMIDQRFIYAQTMCTCLAKRSLPALAIILVFTADSLRGFRVVCRSVDWEAPIATAVCR